MKWEIGEKMQENYINAVNKAVNDDDYFKLFKYDPYIMNIIENGNAEMASAQLKKIAYNWLPEEMLTPTYIRYRYL